MYFKLYLLKFVSKFVKSFEVLESSIKDAAFGICHSTIEWMDEMDQPLDH